MKTFKTYLNEALITFNGRARYGQVVFLAGGSGSGKDFAINKFLDTGFKIFDADKMKEDFIKLNDITHKYPEFLNFNWKDSEKLGTLHHKLKSTFDKRAQSFIAGATNPNTLPNIIFNVTLKNSEKLNLFLPVLIAQGYKPTNIHLVWVLANYNIAIANNAKRKRTVADNIAFETHSGALQQMLSLIFGNLPSAVNGKVSVILNDPDKTLWRKNSKGEIAYNTSGSTTVNKFSYITVKTEGASMSPSKAIQSMLMKWIILNAPEEALKELGIS